MTEEIKKLTKNDLLSWIKEFLNLDYTDEQIMADAYYLKLMEVYEYGYKNCLSKWQEAERWRKVEEEPDNQDIVLVKTDKECFATADYHGKNSGWIVYGDEAYKQFGNIVEWKPIS